jgi:hypothetical protein
VLRLARGPQLLAQVRARLAENRQTDPLFDTARFTGNIESSVSAYVGNLEGGPAADRFRGGSPGQPLASGSPRV